MLLEIKFDEPPIRTYMNKKWTKNKIDFKRCPPKSMENSPPYVAYRRGSLVDMLGKEQRPTLFYARFDPHDHRRIYLNHWHIWSY